MGVVILVAHQPVPAVVQEKVAEVVVVVVVLDEAQIDDPALQLRLLRLVHPPDELIPDVLGGLQRLIRPGENGVGHVEICLPQGISQRPVEGGNGRGVGAEIAHHGVFAADHRLLQQQRGGFGVHAVHAVDQILEHVYVAVVHGQPGAVEENVAVDDGAGKVVADLGPVVVQHGLPQQLAQIAVVLRQPLQPGLPQLLLPLHQPGVYRVVEHPHLGGAQGLHGFVLLGRAGQERADFLLAAMLRRAGEDGVQLCPAQEPGFHGGAELRHAAVLNQGADAAVGVPAQLALEQNGDLLRHVHRVQQPEQGEQQSVFGILHAAVQIVISAEAHRLAGIEKLQQSFFQIGGGFAHRDPQGPGALVILVQVLLRCK